MMMTRRQRVALLVPPVFLRVALGLVFIWAGLGKLLVEVPVQGERAAVLANMNVIPAPAAGPVPTPPPPAPTRPLPRPDESRPEERQPADDPAPEEAVPPPPRAPEQPLPPADPEPEPEDEPVALARGAAGLPPLVRLAPLQDDPVAPGTTAPANPTITRTTTPFTAADFPDPVPVRRLHSLTLRIHEAAYPAPAPDGTARPAIWPEQMARATWPKWLAYAVVTAELGGGVLILIGLFTRLGAFAVALVMAGAIWLDQIGPAVQAGQTVAGFLPGGRGAFDTAAWRVLLWQFTLFMAAWALFFSGPGLLAIDNALFGAGRRGDDDDD